MQALIRPRIAVTASIISSTRCMVSCPGRQLGGFSYDHERESRSQNDQCIYASDRDAEINAGHEPLRLELGFPTEHHASPRNCLFCIRQAEGGHSFRGKKYT